MNFISSLPQLKSATDQLQWGNLQGASLPLVIANLVQEQPAFYLIVVPDTPAALRLEQELAVFHTNKDIPILTLPDWETLPYDVFSPNQDIISQRLKTLYQLPRLTQGIVIVPISTLLLRLTERQYLEQHSFIINKNQLIDLNQLKRQLTEVGYHSVDQVMEHGEFSARGSILDLYPMGANAPYRLDFFDNEVDAIRTFDPDNQRSLDTVTNIELLPAHEFPTDKAAIERFRLRYRELFSSRSEKESLYQQVSQGLLPSGIEYYLPLFAEQTATLFDYLPKQSRCLLLGDLEHSAERFWHELKRRYDDRCHDVLRPILAPQQLYINIEQLFGQFKQYARIKLSQAELTKKAGQANLLSQTLPDLAVNHQHKEPLHAVQQYILQLKQQKGRLLFFVESEGRRESLLQLLQKASIRISQFASFTEFYQSNTDLGIIVGPLEQGCFLSKPQPLALVSENELFGQKISQRRRRKRSQQVSSDTVIRNLAELTMGQPIVHLQHGIGRYQGLQIIETAGISAEFVTIEYAGTSKLYVPITALHLLSRYSGGDADSAPLHKLGNDSWEKSRRKAAEKVRDVAAELLDVYAQRAAHKGYAFAIDQQQYQAFAASFPYEETADQQDSIDAVLRDMQTPQPMDRLVCGDVGFGKTEVAMRAAFVAVNDGKQVAILVPTTLLAQQHFENFSDRFANWPVRVEVLSRFISPKQQKAILEDVSNGKVDILIGTHKLLQDDIKLHDLGLLIVDEEHRFGVRQKEKIKSLRANIDILTLTATPIPRTLNMSMAGMRDLSIIATPPARRLAVKTFVRENDKALIREAVMREISRGGQLYFLHNDVATINQQAQALTELIPEARIAIAHGQMRERELENIMADFYHQRYNVLLCSTIIETGIDIPTANTIIINRADKFGLAQLHQLRGRVGRSHHQAYAYLLIPSKKRLSKDAEKRLDAIESLEDLGAGFALASHDLEIRGAGELLGDEQSGQIESIGFTLYMDMLEQAVNALKQGKEPSLELMLSQQTEIELRIPALLPESYIPDVNLRLSCYKKLASIKSLAELDEIQVELIDRFGLLPDAAKNLVKLSEFKLQAQQLGIKRIEANNKGGMVEFSDKTQVSPNFIIDLIQKQSRIFKLEGGQKLRFAIASNDIADRLKLIENMLADFAKNRVS